MISKSNLLIFIIVLFLGILITNCSDDDEEETLIGTWVLTGVKSDQMGAQVTVPPDAFGLSWTITVKDDNTYTMIITMDGETTTGEGEWETSGDQLFLTEMGETLEYDYSLKGDKLEIPGEIIINGTPTPVTFVFTKQ